ncbi:hypothetical protein MASR1M60_24890 [Rhodocyclaceae bacterium]
MLGYPIFGRRGEWAFVATGRQQERGGDQQNGGKWSRIHDGDVNTENMEARLEERDFLTLADAELARMESALEVLLNAGEVDFDFELKPGGIIEIVLEDGSKLIVNRHAAAQEIWVAARAGGFHFKPPVEGATAWRGTRDGLGLAEVLSRCISEQAGRAVSLTW